MARPKKQTVDYFPHYCQHKKTMYILEQRYGNDGYAFWFKLLEILGDTEGHYIDLNDEAAWEFLQAKTHLSDSLCNEILDLLAKLDAIDKELWNARVVWCQKFVDGLTPVYTNRRVEIPQRPSFYIQKTQPANVSTDINPQSKVKESKVKESTKEILSTATPYDDIIQAYHLCCPSLPKIKKLTEKRKKIIRARWRADPDIEVFCALFRKAETSDFLTGRNGRWTSCNFDWLVNEANMVKVLEGIYDNKGGGNDERAWKDPGGDMAGKFREFVT